MDFSPSSSTGTLSDWCGAIDCFSVKHHGMVSAASPLCASAILVRQQYGLKGRIGSAPTSSKSLRVMLIPRDQQTRHCERSEAIQSDKIRLDCFVASLLAM